MKSIISLLFSYSKTSQTVSISVLILRVIAGVFMLTHGYGKLLMLFAEGPIYFLDPIGLGMTLSLSLVVFAEFLCSIFLIFGIFTRLSTLPLLFTMFIAAFVFHLNDGFASQELALLYATIYIVIAIIGPGKFSMDYIISGKMSK